MRIIRFTVLIVFALCGLANAQVPVGVAPPAGKSWSMTFDDEFNGTSVDASKWNYGFSGDSARCIPAGCTQGVVCSTLACNDGFNFHGVTFPGGNIASLQGTHPQCYTSPVSWCGEPSGFADYAGAAQFNTATKFVQRYGFWEASIKLPPNNANASGQGSGFAFAVDAASDPGCPGGADQMVALENSNGGNGVGGGGSQFSEQISVVDCDTKNTYQNIATSSADLSASFHTYGMNWVNDGTPNGTIYFYIDGALKGQYTLTNRGQNWVKGIYMYVVGWHCYYGNILGGGACTSNDTEPTQVHYVRAWQAVSGTSTPTPIPTSTASPIPTSTPTPTTACNPVLVTPVANSTLSGSVTFTISGCSMTGRFLRPYFDGMSDWPAGASSVTVDTTKLANTSGGWSGIVWDSATGTVKYGMTALTTLTICNGASCATPTPISTPSPVPTPLATASPSPTPTPAPTPSPAACGFTYTASQIIANCPIVAPGFITSGGTPTPSPSSMPTPVPVAGVTRANDFLNSLGVTSHIVQQGYTPAQWEVAWDYLGVRHDRDDFTCDGCDPHNWNANFFIPEHQKRGVTFVGMPYAATGITDLSATFSQWDQLGAAGALFAVEGANEPNNQPFSYKGQSCNWSTGGDGSGCGPFQHDLLAATRADANTKNLPMFSVTEGGAMTTPNDGEQFITGYADYANLHNYVKPNNNTLTDNAAWNAEDPDHSINSVDGMDGEFVNVTWRNHYPASPVGTGASIPRVTTETGWDSTSGLTADQIGKVLASVLLDGATRGWSYTLIYQIMDDSHDSFGLFNNANPPTPKLAATYIHNLTTILADTSSAFTPVAVMPSISPMPSTVHSLLMQKSNGTYELAVWDEAFVSQTVTTVTISLGTTYNTVNVYDITSGTTGVSSGPASSVTLNLKDHPMIVEFK